MNMRNPFLFFSDLLKQPAWIPIWVMALMVVNMASIVFWSEPLAKIIFATFMLSAMLMMGLYSRFGFEKILGLGHVFWIPLLAYILIHIQEAESGFQAYLAVLSVFIGVSLVFDVIDVWKYFSSAGAPDEGAGEGRAARPIRPDGESRP